MCKHTVSFFVFLGLFTASSLLAEQHVSGVILEREGASPVLRIQFDGIPQGQDSDTLRVRVGAGDWNYLRAGDPIRGRLLQEPDGLRMETIWPNDAQTAAQMTAINNQLRRDTGVRGRKVFRSVGESMPPFALYNQFGELVTHRDLKGHTVVVNFIFTRCRNPRMCPAATARMHNLQEVINEHGLEDVRLVSMTLDPDYDTPGVFNTYAYNRSIEGRNFLFLGGPRQALLDLKEQLGILAMPDEKEIINHTMRTILVDPSGKIVYQVPGSQWSVDDFLTRIEKLEVDNLTAVTP